MPVHYIVRVKEKKKALVKPSWKKKCDKPLTHNNHMIILFFFYISGLSRLDQLVPLWKVLFAHS